MNCSKNISSGNTAEIDSLNGRGHQTEELSAENNSIDAHHDLTPRDSAVVDHAIKRIQRLGLLDFQCVCDLLCSKEKCYRVGDVEEDTHDSGGQLA